MIWTPCPEKESTAYAVVKNNQYLCVQGDQTWYQDECNGWAVCSSDYNWVTRMASENGGGTITPMRIKPNDNNDS